MAKAAGGGKQWGGRFREPLDPRALAFSESLSFDWRLYPYDVAASVAHARMLGRQGIISKKAAGALVRGLRQVKKDIEAGTFPYHPELEDIHTNIEARLRDKCGADVAGQLHTGRSRNDQVATDLRLYLMDELGRIEIGLRNLQAALLGQADRTVDLIMPGMTHLQHAQPVRVAHHMLAYVDMFARDTVRFERVAAEVRRLPLGSGALAGTTFPIDAASVAEELGFSQVMPNSMAAVADRDAAVDVLAAVAITMMHLSRLSEELVLWSSSEFGYVALPEAFTTGSSMMPQKQNPDMAELVRGKTGRAYGALVSLLTTLKGLPLAYNRDLQEDKQPVFDAIDTLNGALSVFPPMLEGLAWSERALTAACADGFLGATDMADYLVTKGVPFREAHGIVGAIVRHCIDAGASLEDLGLSTLRKFSTRFQRDAIGRFSVAAVVEARDTPGGTAKKRVRAALRTAHRRLDNAGGAQQVPPAQWQAAPGPR